MSDNRGEDRGTGAGGVDDRRAVSLAAAMSRGDQAHGGGGFFAGFGRLTGGLAS